MSDPTSWMRQGATDHHERGALALSGASARERLSIELEELREDVEGIVPLDDVTLDLLEVAERLSGLGGRMVRLASDLQQLFLFEAAVKAPLEVPPPFEGQSAGGRVHQLREAMGLTVAELSHASQVSEDTVRGVERGKPYRARIFTCLAHGLAGVAGGTQLDAGDLALELKSAAEKEGAVRPAGEYDGVWLAKRLDVIRGGSAETVRQLVMWRRALAQQGTQLER